MRKAPVLVAVMLVTGLAHAEASAGEFLQLFGFSSGKTRALLFLSVLFILVVVFRFLYSRHRQRMSMQESATGRAHRVFEVFQAGNLVLMAYLLLLTAGSCVFGVQHTLQWGGRWFWYFLPDSIVLLAWALLLQLAYFLWPGRPKFLVGLCLLGLVTGFLLVREAVNWIILGTIFGLAMVVRAALRYRFLLIRSFTATLVALLGFMVVFSVVLGSLPAGSRVNELGLVSFEPGTEREIDFSGYPNKDNYPVCRFKYNSLGYRDREPDGDVRDRVLIVGDSYVWGDGIPANEQTLGALLRQRLEGVEPGRFGVVSAAYPGNGIYGYSRFITALEQRFRPSVVVIGYLGCADLDPLDAQFLMDSLPKNGFLRNLVVNLRLLQGVHEKSVTIGCPLWLQSPPLSRVVSALDVIVASKPPSRRCIVVIDYFRLEPKHPLAFPKDWRVLQLPESLRCPGHHTQYWYAKDVHPKPALNLRLAEILADTVRDCVGK